MAARNDKMHVGVRREGCSIRFWFIRHASHCGHLFIYLFLIETNCSEQGCHVCLPKSVSLSWPRPGLSLPLNVATLDRFMKMQTAARGFLPTVCTVYTVFGEKPGTLCNTPAICLCLSITLFVFSAEYKESNCFCSAAMHLFSHYLYCCRERTFWKEK